MQPCNNTWPGLGRKVCNIQVDRVRPTTRAQCRSLYTAIQWVSLLRIFSCRVATINRVERRGERVSEFRADVLVLVLVVRASRACAVCDSVVASCVVADGA